MLNLFISGISGKMGTALYNFIDKNKKDYRFIGGYNSKTRSSDIDSALLESDLILDFSSPIVLNTILQKAVLFQKKLLIGTTGLSQEQLNNLYKFSQNIPIFYSPNFSISLHFIANILGKSRFLTKNYDIHIIDMHHKGKKDAPSGTSQILKHKLESSKIAQNISQSSIRIANALPEHSILLANQFETIKITHKILNYESMIKNIFTVIDWLIPKKPGYYNLDDFISEYII